MDKMKLKKPTHISSADENIEKAKSYLENYIEQKIIAAGSVTHLCDETGIPRSSIVVTLRRGNILGLRALAYRLAGLGRPKESKG